MYKIYKNCGYVVKCEEIWKAFLDTHNPPTTQSQNWKHWKTNLGSGTCYLCIAKHGKIYEMDEIPDEEPPLHVSCRCEIVPLYAIIASEGTKDKQNGADWWIKNYNELPQYYISNEDIAALGWKRGKSPAKYAPNKMLTGGIYKNGNKHLPDAVGRIWHEADINYYEGRRNGHRLLWSNDGLVFVTYDHYATFHEII